MRYIRYHVSHFLRLRFFRRLLELQHGRLQLFVYPKQQTILLLDVNHGQYARNVHEHHHGDGFLLFGTHGECQEHHKRQPVQHPHDQQMNIGQILEGQWSNEDHQHGIADSHRSGSGFLGAGDVAKVLTHPLSVGTWQSRAIEKHENEEHLCHRVKHSSNEMIAKC